MNDRIKNPGPEHRWNHPRRFDLKKLQRAMTGISIFAILAAVGIYTVIITCNDAESQNSDVLPGLSAEDFLSAGNGEAPSRMENRQGSFSQSTDSNRTNTSSVSRYSLDLGDISASNDTVSRRSSIAETKTSEKDLYTPLIIEPSKTSETIAATVSFFKERVPFLQKSLQNSGLYYEEKLLDPATSTKAYIVAKNQKYAGNLNGYFYFLLDETGSTDVISPFVLNISLLFDEENRKMVTDSGTFAETRHVQALKQSLTAALGPYYTEAVFTFIMDEYKVVFQNRINGKPHQNSIFKLQASKMEVVFHDSFMTYVEFFIDNQGIRG